MSTTWRIVFTVSTSLTVAVLLYGMIASLLHNPIFWGIAVVCLLLTGMFSVFLYNDYKFYTTKTTVAPAPVAAAEETKQE